MQGSLSAPSPAILVLDLAGGSLGEFALRLARLGQRVHYASDLDEAFLRVGAERARLRIIVLDSRNELELRWFRETGDENRMGVEFATSSQDGARGQLRELMHERTQQFRV